jgi:hypothetical protein
MEEDRVVHTIQKNQEEEFRLSLHSYKDRQYLDLRVWFLPATGNEYRPSKKGITLSVEYLPELKKGVQRALDAISEMPLQPTPNSIK